MRRRWFRLVRALLKRWCPARVKVILSPPPPTTAPPHAHPPALPHYLPALFFAPWDVYSTDSRHVASAMMRCPIVFLPSSTPSDSFLSPAYFTQWVEGGPILSIPPPSFTPGTPQSKYFKLCCPVVGQSPAHQTFGHCPDGCRAAGPRGPGRLHLRRRHRLGGGGGQRLRSRRQQRRRHPLVAGKAEQGAYSAGAEDTWSCRKDGFAFPLDGANLYSASRCAQPPCSAPFKGLLMSAHVCWSHPPRALPGRICPRRCLPLKNKHT